jgi:hypothetical protein
MQQIVRKSAPFISVSHMKQSFNVLRSGSLPEETDYGFQHGEPESEEKDDEEKDDEPEM